MRVTNIADACLLFEHRRTRLLTDPWIGTPTYGCWLQYPPPVVTPEDLGRLDYIFISHLHEDHCDFATLARLDPNARIVIAEHPPHLLRRFLLNNGIERARVIEVPPRTRRTIGDLVIEPIESNPAHEYARLVDSAALIHSTDRTVYFANDSKPYEGSDRYIADRYRVDLALLPFAGGSGYPACYTNLTEVEKRAEATRIMTSYLDSLAKSIAVLRPRAVTPVASWHVLAGWAFDLNPFMSWLPSAEPIERFMSALGPGAPELWLLGPGQGVALDTGERLGGEFRRFSAEERLAFARDRLREARPRHEALPDSGAIPIERLFRHACADWRRRAPLTLPAGFRYAFDCHDGALHVLDPANGEVSRETGPLEPPYLKVTLDRRLFALLLINAASWNIEDVTGSLRYERVPNRYHPEVHAALNYIKL